MKFSYTKTVEVEVNTSKKDFIDKWLVEARVMTWGERVIDLYTDSSRGMIQRVAFVALNDVEYDMLKGQDLDKIKVWLHNNVRRIQTF